MGIQVFWEEEGYFSLKIMKKHMHVMRPPESSCDDKLLTSGKLWQQHPLPDVVPSSGWLQSEFNLKAPTLTFYALSGSKGFLRVHWGSEQDSSWGRERKRSPWLPLGFSFCSKFLLSLVKV